MKVVVSSDWHLDAVTDGVRRYPDASQAAEASVNYAIREGADLFVFAGDLADPDSAGVHRAVAFAAACVARLRVHDIDVVFVRGNHDVLEDGSGDSVLDSLRSIGAYVAAAPGMFVFDRITLIYLPFAPASHSYDPDDWVRSLHVNPAHAGNPVMVVGHLNAEGIATGSESTRFARGRSVFWPLDALRECFPDALLVGGHYHRAQEYRGIHIVGSQARLRHDEEDHEPSFLVVEVDDGETQAAA